MITSEIIEEFIHYKYGNIVHIRFVNKYRLGTTNKYISLFINSMNGCDVFILKSIIGAFEYEHKHSFESIGRWANSKKLLC